MRVLWWIGGAIVFVLIIAKLFGSAPGEDCNWNKDTCPTPASSSAG